MTKKFRVTGVEALACDSAVRGGVEEARQLATALLAKKADGSVQDGLIIAAKDLVGNHPLPEIGVVVRVIELLPVAATC